MRNLFAIFVTAMFLHLLSSVTSADSLDEIQKRGVLRWGGDDQGGGPYIFRDPNNAQRLIGFEIDLMEQLSHGLGVQSEFKQCQWDDLLKFLGSRQCDVVVNGYELTAERLETAIATIPYYIYELHLFTRQDDLTKALVAGEVDAMSADSPVTGFAVKLTRKSSAPGFTAIFTVRPSGILISFSTRWLTSPRESGIVTRPFSVS